MRFVNYYIPFLFTICTVSQLVWNRVCTCLIMNVAYLKVTFFFLGTGLLMSFHGHLRSAAKIRCERGGRGRGNDASRVFFLFFF